MKLEKVRYQEPILERQVIGKRPQTRFTAEKEVQDSVDLQSVWATVPQKNADGSAKLREVEVDLDLRPRNPWLYGSLGAAAGALLGLAGGAALLRAVPLWAVSAGAGAAAGAVGGAAMVWGEKVKVVWSTEKISDPKFLGYQHFQDVGEKDGQRGFFQRYVPDIEWKEIGTYQVPSALRYKA